MKRTKREKKQEKKRAKRHWQEVGRARKDGAEERGKREDGMALFEYK